MIVAIDGPAGAGKSTVARLVAADLGFGYLNTGSMYRAVALAAMREGADLGDGAAVARIARERTVRLGVADGADQVFLDEEEITVQVRRPEVSAVVSEVAAHPELREVVIRWQREVLDSGDWVADGRDIGSVVAPHADLKVYLTADAGERARRRHAELADEPGAPTFDQVHADIMARDARDEGRAASPLVVADGASVVDTTGLTIEEVVDVIGGQVRDMRGDR